MSATDELLRNAESYASNFDGGELPLPPARKIAIVAVFDVADGTLREVEAR